jgi:inositol transport system substrate-binding protein
MWHFKSILIVVLIGLILEVLMTCNAHGVIWAQPFPKRDYPKNITTTETSSNNPPLIGATFLGYNEFPKTIMQNMVREAKVRHIRILTYDGKNSPEIQIANIRDMIKKHVDVIVLNPVDADRCVTCVQMAIKAGIPILGVNAMVKSDQLLTYIGSNDMEAGETEMQFMAEKIKGGGNIVIMDGVTGQSSQIQRTQGILNVLRGYPRIKILDEKSGNWFRSQGYQLIKKWYAQYGSRINAIVSQNDEMALGAIGFLEERGLLGKIPVVGIDALPDAIEAVRNGKLDATIYQDAEIEGRLAVDLAIKIYRHENIAKSYFIPLKLVTKENVDQFPFK